MIDLTQIKADNKQRKEILRRDPRTLLCYRHSHEKEIDFLLAEIVRLRLLARDLLRCEETPDLPMECDRKK